jgi:glycosyltransferase involved in cell wall biosynthesis
MVEEHGAGLAVPAGDPAALAQALRRLRAEQEAGELAVRADAARRFAQDRLSVDAAARSLVSTAADPA